MLVRGVLKDAVCRLEKLDDDIVSLAKRKENVADRSRQPDRRVDSRNCGHLSLTCNLFCELKVKSHDIRFIRAKIKSIKFKRMKYKKLYNAVCRISMSSMKDLSTINYHVATKKTITENKIAVVTPLLKELVSDFFQGISVAGTDDLLDLRGRCGYCTTCRSSADVPESRRCLVANKMTKSHHRNIETISTGDYISVQRNCSSDFTEIYKVASIWKSDNRRTMLHGRLLISSSETVLGDIGDPKELFVVDRCRDITLNSVIGKCTVEYKQLFENCEGVANCENNTFFCQKRYDEPSGRFENLPAAFLQMDLATICCCCARNNSLSNMKTPVVECIIDQSCMENNSKYRSLSFMGVTYHVGDTVYLCPKLFDIGNESEEEEEEHNVLRETINEDIFTERYRKADRFAGNKESQLQVPFRIGDILAISSMPNGEIEMRIRKYYRPEDTYRGLLLGDACNFNELYWSNQEDVVSPKMLRGRCAVSYVEDVKLGSACCEEPNNFYFREAYDEHTRSFPAVPKEVKQLRKEKGSGNDPSMLYQNASFTKLRTMDVFAGCGGLSEGLHQAGLCETLWAIENDENAAKTFRNRNPQATVFTQDCNEFLRSIILGHRKDSKGNILPLPGEVDMICGGCPCQGFSRLNRFSSGKSSSFKNSLLATFLSFCDYYRPKYFLLENVRNFSQFERGMVLKLTLKCLLRMGYQCTFTVLQAGNYGVPQNRRRTIILAAAPGVPLPEFPAPTHCFMKRASGLSVNINGVKYSAQASKFDSAPYRAVTVEDAIFDLPDVINKEENSTRVCEYTSPYQRQVCENANTVVVRDHVCKKLNALTTIRVQHIPIEPGSDWRNLPNIRVQMPNGKYTETLKYLYNDEQNGCSHSGKKRGVCTCAAGKPCESNCRQKNTLIPWSLVHTANRHNNWSNSLARLQSDWFFGTMVTDVNPLKGTAPMLHPTQDRTVSVREVARSQGFSDDYHFEGSVSDKYRQLGNAVPPPLAKAIGLEIMRCMVEKDGSLS